MVGPVTDETLGVTLKKLRAAAGMTQEELADRAGISARTVSDVERASARSSTATQLDGSPRRSGFTTRSERSSKPSPGASWTTRISSAICRYLRPSCSVEHASWRASQRGFRAWTSVC